MMRLSAQSLAQEFLPLATLEFHFCRAKFLKRLINYDVGMGCEVVPSIPVR
jgi:hypothetical protein